MGGYPQRRARRGRGPGNPSGYLLIPSSLDRKKQLSNWKMDRNRYSTRNKLYIYIYIYNISLYYIYYNYKYNRAKCRKYRRNDASRGKGVITSFNFTIVLFYQESWYFFFWIYPLAGNLVHWWQGSIAIQHAMHFCLVPCWIFVCPVLVIQGDSRGQGMGVQLPSLGFLIGSCLQGQEVPRLDGFGPPNPTWWK